MLGLSIREQPILDLEEPDANQLLQAELANQQFRCNYQINTEQDDDLFEPIDDQNKYSQENDNLI